jgi:hypothetical protein
MEKMNGFSFSFQLVANQSGSPGRTFYKEIFSFKG